MGFTKDQLLDRLQVSIFTFKLNYIIFISYCFCWNLSDKIR